MFREAQMTETFGDNQIRTILHASGEVPEPKLTSVLNLSFLKLFRNILSNTCLHSILCFRKHGERSKVCK